MAIYITIDLGELCSPFRYSYPSGCINSVILNGRDVSNKNNSKNENEQLIMSEEMLNEAFNSTDNIINISRVNLTQPLCIYR